MDESIKFEWGPFFRLLRVSGIISCRETSAGTLEQSKFWEFYSLCVVVLVTLLKIFLCFSGEGNRLQGFFSSTIWWLDWHGTYLLNLIALYWVVLKRLKTSVTANEMIAILGSLPEEDSLSPETLHLTAYVIISVSSLVLYYSSHAIPGVEMDSRFSCIFIMTLYTYMDLMVDVFYDTFMINLKYIFEKLNRTLLKTRVVNRGLLFRLRKVHHRCVEVADSIRNCFCVSLLAKVVEEFFILVEDLSAIVWTLDHGQALMRTIFWTFLYVLKFSTRVYSSAKVKVEAEKTAAYLHELFIENDDPQVREEIEIFSLQLLHRRVQFDACGFFKLDFTLLNSMIGAVTTYIVILIQFQMAGKNTCATTNTTVHTNEV